MEENKNTWCVYRHTSPSGKVYIGVTHHINPELRYGKNGISYKPCVVFYRAIVKYGWENITHEILFENLSEKEAKQKEIELIKFYHDQNISYNMTIGGDGRNLGLNSDTHEYKLKQSRLFRQLHPNYDKEQYIKYCEKKKETVRKYYQNNREKVLAYKRTDKVKEKARIRAAEWRKKHPDYMKNYMKIYNQNLKEKHE